MAHHKSAIKRIQIAARNQARNRRYKTMLKNQITKVRSATDKKEAEALYIQTTSLLDKLVNKGIIHRNRAANQKSKLATHVNKL